jgi:putative PIN family toxin of toxin-antitoxin system
VRLVIDTNILISALLVQGSLPAQLIELWREGKFDLLLSAEQLDEPMRVTRYPKIRQRLVPALAGRLINELREVAMIVQDLAMAQAGEPRFCCPATSAICFTSSSMSIPASILCATSWRRSDGCHDRREDSHPDYGHVRKIADGHTKARRYSRRGLACHAKERAYPPGLPARRAAFHEDARYHHERRTASGRPSGCDCLGTHHARDEGTTLAFSKAQARKLLDTPAEDMIEAYVIAPSLAASGSIAQAGPSPRQHGAMAYRRRQLRRARAASARSLSQGMTPTYA